MILDCESTSNVMLECKDDKSNAFFRDIDEKFSINYLTEGICREGLTSGIVMPFLRISCPKCSGSLRNPQLDQCRHVGASVAAVEILEPDMITQEDGGYSLIPNRDLQSVVINRKPKEVFNKIAPFVRKLVIEGKRIPIDDQSISLLQAPSLVRNLMDGCSSVVASELGIMWRKKVHEWVRDRMVARICSMSNLKVPDVSLVDTRVKTLQKYSAISGCEETWQSVRNKLNDF